jgi:ribonuclease HI
MTEFEQLTALAFHAEKVASRRLAVKEAISEEIALKKILQSMVGTGSLLQLLAYRQSLVNTKLERLATRRQKKIDERSLKSTQNPIPDGTWLAWFDGSARPNPGRCGIGAVLKGPNDEHIEICRYVGHGDSSDAEYSALIATLEMAVQLQVISLVVYGDSRVVIDDVKLATGTASNLLGHRTRAQFLMSQLHMVRLCWIPRHKNLEADMLSQRAS